MKKLLLMTVAALAAGAQAQEADPVAGKAFFRAQCGLCHSAEPGDNGGAQGPALHEVFGREAAADSAYPYSQALSASDLHWDAETLDRFLAAPTEVVPGSTMVVAVADESDRENLVAYLKAVTEGSYEEPERAGFGGPFGGFTPPPPEEPPEGDPDWKLDAPGRVHRIDLSQLPEPYDTPSANNFPRLVEKPADAELQLPEGFRVELFADEGLQAPRAMTVAPNGDIFLAETLAGRIKLMRPSADGSRAETTEIFAQGLVQPLGIALYPPGDQPEWVYVAEMNRVVRYPYQVGDQVASDVPEVVVPELSPVGGGHYTRDLVFSSDGRQMFVSVGSQSNVAEDISKKSPEEVAAWEAEYGLGAAWDQETNRAAVLVFDHLEPGAPGRIYATGLRNCVGLTRQPATGDIWCAVNERDMLGDDLVPDFATRVQEGGFYGWPWYYMGDYEDPRLAGDRPDLRGKVLEPDVPFTAHSASTDIVFYPGNEGASAFPEDYVGEGFAVLHGSWNRAFRTGHKVVRLPIEDGEPTGEYIDFMVGFITEEGNAWGRPVALAVAKDGSLLVSDDGANLIYRISYEP